VLYFKDIPYGTFSSRAERDVFPVQLLANSRKLIRFPRKKTAAEKTVCIVVEEMFCYYAYKAQGVLPNQSVEEGA